MSLELQNPRLLAELRPFLVATRENRRWFELAPFGVELRGDHCLDPLQVASKPLLDRLCALDRASFGPQDMPMPRWIFLDAGELSGGVVGFAIAAAALPPSARALLEVPHDQWGPVPLSMYIALPGFEPGSWVGHNLASVGRRVPELELAGLGRLTKAFALTVFRAQSQVGACQWQSPALRVHARLGPLEILTAWTPAHSKPWTLTYRARVDDEALRSLAGDPRANVRRPAPDDWLASDDHAGMQRLQERVEAGERWLVAGPPESGPNGAVRVPLAAERDTATRLEERA